MIFVFCCGKSFVNRSMSLWNRSKPFICSNLTLNRSLAYAKIRKELENVTGPKFFSKYSRCLVVSRNDTNPASSVELPINRYSRDVSCRRMYHRNQFERYLNQSPDSSRVVIGDEFYKDQVDNRFIVLGKSVLRGVLTEHFLKTYPDVSALDIVNLVTHVTLEILPLKLSTIAASNESIYRKRANMYLEIGRYFEEEGKDFIFEKFISLLSEKFKKSEIETYSKLAHPGVLLKEIASKLDLQLEVRQAGIKTVAIYVNESLAAESTASSLEKAEYAACLEVIKKHYMNEIANVDPGDADNLLAKGFKGKLDGQRVVELAKEAGETYGLFLKGGEKATIQTKKFWQYHFIEPVFINKIVEGSPASMSGRLKEGDVILAVGDFTLKGVHLKNAVSMINEEDTVTLTVKFDPQIKIRNKIKTEFIEREKKAFKGTLKSDEWRKWHEANAEKNPQKYLKMT